MTDSAHLHSPHPLLDFRNPALLQQALTHRSYVNDYPGTVGDNERLEFLGDAILTFLSGEYFYCRYPAMQEGEMTRQRSAMVDKTQLARFALELRLDQRLRLSDAMARNAGHRNEKLLSSAFEAVVGAYFLDRDRSIDALRPLIEALFDAVPETARALRAIIDPQNQLQEWVHTHVGPTLPSYSTVRVGGADHNPEFSAEVKIADRIVGRGLGRSQTEAKRNAAESALSLLQAERSALSPEL